ncbi:B-cell antigen receptor complex-associated protein beta chain [Genypterus blacodes]|uniref:B-cell antigen receptor complex-associated protein beta chain n=1 Tax=Genypterus blacodes TaxID=154954 RepID=UPI003F7590EA
MRWVFAGCCGIALINLSAAFLVTQTPRFFGSRTGPDVRMFCKSSESRLNTETKWYKASKFTGEFPKDDKLKTDKRLIISNVNGGLNSLLFLRGVTREDSGVYYCKINDTWGPGTELQIVRHINLEKAMRRSEMKDGLMFLQGLLLAGCISAFMLRRRTLSTRSDSEYEEPEIDHIYEGLAIETCGLDLYEDISVYAQADEAEVPWE